MALKFWRQFLTEELVRQGQYMTLFASGDSAGAAFLLLQACLGLSVLGLDRRLVFSRTVLPEFLEQVTIRNLRIGEARVDLSLSRDKQDVRIDVLRKQGDLKIVVLNSDLSVPSRFL